MIDVICWKWRPASGYRSKFSAAHVNTLRAMIARHYPEPHRFSCITDDAEGLDSRVRVIPLWEDHSKMISPHGPANPSCYRRLRAFARDAADLIGPRFVSLDLDCVVTGDLRPIFNRPEAFVMWEGQVNNSPYNGSMFMMDAGARAQVWETFDPVESPRRGSALNYVGSDQAWIGACLGRNEAKWTLADGVYSWRMHLRRNRGMLPADARLVFFHGSSGDPWQPIVQKRAPWILDHWHEGESGHVEGQHV